MKLLRLSAFLVALSGFGFLGSCNEDDDDSAGSSRAIRYEISGNFSGSLFASYTTASGGTTNEAVSQLPWSKDITYENSVAAAIIALSGNGGTAGQQLMIIVKRGGKQVSSTPVTAGSSGSFTIAAPVVTF